jgi:hypothetical protein
MKLHEEFKEYETLWDEPLKESFIKTFEGKDYDLTDEAQLEDLIDLLTKREAKKYKNSLSLNRIKHNVRRNLFLQLKHERADHKVLEILEDQLISNKD